MATYSSFVSVTCKHIKQTNIAGLPFKLAFNYIVVYCRSSLNLLTY